MVITVFKWVLAIVTHQDVQRARSLLIRFLVIICLSARYLFMILLQFCLDESSLIRRMELNQIVEVLKE